MRHRAVPQRLPAHRYPGRERHPGDAGLALVEPAVRRTRALGIDADAAAVGQHLQHRGQALQADPAAGPVQRHLADGPRNQATIFDERPGRP